MFQLEEAVGPVRGVIVLDSDLDVRRSRQAKGGVLTPGQEHLLATSVDNFVREKASIVQFFEKIGKVRTVRGNVRAFFTVPLAAVVCRCRSSLGVLCHVVCFMYVVQINTKKSPDDVYTDALPFLE